MVNVPGAITIHITYGAVEYGQWCDEHLLPHRTSTKVYGLTPGGTTLSLGEMAACDEDDE